MKTQVLAIAISLLGAAGVATADQDDSHRGAGEFHDGFHDGLYIRTAATFQAPEIDPISMIVALTLLGSAFAVLRGRHPKS